MKKIFALLLAALMVFSLAACGGEKTVSGGGADEPTVIEQPAGEPNAEATEAPADEQPTEAPEETAEPNEEKQDAEEPAEEKQEEEETTGDKIVLKDDMEAAQAKVLEAVEQYLRDAWGDKIDDLEVTVDKVYTAEEEEADELLKSLGLGEDEVAFSVNYKLHPAEGVEDLIEFTAATGEIDEESGWIVDKSNVGVLRPNPDGEGYIVTDFGTGF